jgi:Lamin Tail Domain
MRKIIMFPLTAIIGLIMAIGLVTATGAPAQAAVYRMQIHEIWYNSPGPDLGGNSSLNHEWVQLHNTSGSAINLTGWTLRDKAGHVFTFGSYTIRPHGYVTIHTGHGSSTQTDQYWNHSWYIWNNTGDTAILRNQNGATVGKCTYKGTSLGYVYC